MKKTAGSYLEAICTVDKIYEKEMKQLETTIVKKKKSNWNDFTEEEKKTTENAVLLTGLLFNMCKVKIVEPAQDKEQLNEINKKEIEKTESKAQEIIRDYNLA